MTLPASAHGFDRTGSRPLPELDATLHYLTHTRTGLRLVWLDRADENKTFGIAFRTEPWDDTGVFHILEHSVLNGSEKYPLKEPFVELLKSSMNTFLNAMTFPDKTFYPVSSRNDKDFMNLVGVYLDAVFCPSIHQNPNIFYQEGWHYELDQEGNATYKGVVFNEMKGAFASPDTVMEEELMKRLFPDTCYGYCSGGDPTHIPELTYEAFTAAHKRLYHPSNAYVFLDGALELEPVLALLDGEYLSRFEPQPSLPPMAVQAPVNGGRARVDYELGAEEPLEGRGRVAWGTVVGTFADREDVTLLRALADVLTGDNHAPLKRCILEKGLARDVSLSVQDGTLQPFAVLEVQDMDPDKVDEIRAILNAELERLVREGVDKKRLSATLTNTEFQMRERDFGTYPRGLVFGMTALDSWLYGGDPAAFLEVGDLFTVLRERCAQGYAEELLERLLLKSDHICEVLMCPSHTLGEERRAAEAARLRQAAESWTPEERQAVAERQAALEAWQHSEDSPEALAALPRLTLGDISTQPMPLPLEERREGELPVLYHPTATAGILYRTLYFDVTDWDEEAISAGGLLCTLMGELPTAHYDGPGLQSAQRELFGSAHFGVEPYGPAGQPDKTRIFLVAAFSALEEKGDAALELALEVLAHTDLSRPDQVRELLRQRLTGMSQALIEGGHACAIARVRAGLCAEGVVTERLAGFSAYRWLKELEEHFEERYPALRAQMEALRDQVLCTARLTLSLTGDEGQIAPSVRGLMAALPGGAPAGAQKIAPWGPKREGIAIPGDVGYASVGLDLAHRNIPVSGQVRVAGKILSLAYLWNAVRVQGGAYGVGLRPDLSGGLGTYSFRDPTPGRTLDCYRKMGSFLAETAGQMEDLDRFILGTISDSEPLLTPRLLGRLADGNYWRGVTWEDRVRTRGEILGAKPRDMVELAEVISAMDGSDGLCVVAPQPQLEHCGPLDQISTL